MQQPAVSVFILGFVVLTAVVAVLGAILARRRCAAELAALRTAKATLEGQVAVEQVRSSRVSGVEQALANQTQITDELRAAKADADQRCAAATGALSGVEAALRDAQARIAEMARERDAAGTRLDAARDGHARLEAQHAAQTALLAEKADALELARTRLTEAEGAHDAVRAECGSLRTQLATVQETLGNERLHAAEKLRLLQDAKESMTKEFRLLADDVMARHGESFTKQNKEQVGGLLQPMRDKLAELQQSLHDAHKASATERATLGEQIRGLSETSARMTSETTNLTRALKGKAQTQGAWGEMLLASILERSGLRAGAEYITQASHTTEDGQRLRPDVIVKLPGNRCVVIDSKVSLVAFEGHVNAETDRDREECLERHLASVRTHVKSLGSKEYQSSVGTSLDYVVMFVPIEGAIAAALRRDPALTSFADQNNVAILTPTTLMIALRTVENVWRAERRNQNAEKIAVSAGKLYDKFCGFAKDMEGLGERLNQAQGAYQGAMGKLKDGTGNLVRQVEKLKDMGARTSKSLPLNLLGDEEDGAPTFSETVTTLPLRLPSAEPVAGAASG